MPGKAARLARSTLVTRSANVGRQLSTREQRVLELIADGRTNRAIGSAFTPEISENTVKNIVRRMMDKLGALDRANAVHIGHQKGLLV